MSMLMQASIRGDIVGNAFANVFHFLCADSGGEAAAPMAAKLADTLNDSAGWLYAYANMQYTGVVYHSIVTRRVDGPGPAYILFAPELHVPGGQDTTLGTEIEPPNISLGIKWNVTPIKRSGRSFISGISEAAFTAGILDDTWVTTLALPFTTIHLSTLSNGTFTATGVVRHSGGFNGGFSYPIDADFARYPYQQGRRRYPIGG